MYIVDQSHKSDYVMEYYIICALSFMTFKKIKKIEQLKRKLKEKKEIQSNRNLWFLD